jgi:HK97 gp10 family phage protein
MTDKINVKVVGIDKVLRELRGLRADMATKHGRSAVRKSAAVVRDAISLEAERKFSRGRRRGSFTDVAARVKPRRELAPHTVGYVVGFKGPAYHWHFLEYGTRERVQKKTGRRTGRVTKRPFIRPAFERSKRRALDRMLDELATPLKKYR